jgi:hypothetical protein
MKHVTTCKHYFHAECLGSWVNESAIRSLDTFPECRRLLYKAIAQKLVNYDNEGVGGILPGYVRQRQHGSLRTLADGERELALESPGKAGVLVGHIRFISTP